MYDVGGGRWAERVAAAHFLWAANLAGPPTFEHIFHGKLSKYSVYYLTKILQLTSLTLKF